MKSGHWPVVTHTCSGILAGECWLGLLMNVMEAMGFIILYSRAVLVHRNKCRMLCAESIFVSALKELIVLPLKILKLLPSQMTTNASLVPSSLVISCPTYWVAFTCGKIQFTVFRLVSCHELTWHKQMGISFVPYVEESLIYKLHKCGLLYTKCVIKCPKTKFLPFGNVSFKHLDWKGRCTGAVLSTCYETWLEPYKHAWLG